MKHASSPISVAVDSIIFTVRRGELMALLIQMTKKPFHGKWAFPGGLVDVRETSETAARRMLKEQTGVTEVYLEQLATFDEVKRDPSGRVMSVAYFALMPDAGIQLKTNEKYSDVRWWPVRSLPALAYDHEQMAKVALKRLQAKLEYTNIVWSLLPEEFTLTDLQKVYETILGRDLDKRNFRRKILSLGLIKPGGKKRKGESHRPAVLYRFKERRLKYVDIL